MTLGIYGSGGLGREVLFLSKQINELKSKWAHIIFIDDFATAQSQNEVDIFSFENMRKQYDISEIEISIALGEPKYRYELANRVSESGFLLATLIYPSVVIPETTQVGEGSILASNSYISCDVTIGKNVLLQPHASVGHNCIIQEHSVLSSFVSLGGNCKIGKKTFIGMSVPVKEGISIGDNVIVGMGSCVQRDIPEHVIAMGNPARAIRNNDKNLVFE